MPKSASKKLAHRSGWKKYQQKNSQRRKVKFGLAALGLLVGLVVVGKAVEFIGHLNSPLYQEKSSFLTSASLWEGSTTLNVVVKADGVYVFSFNPNSKSLLTLKMPEETYVNLPLGFGKWPLRSVYGLGQAENPPIGASLLTATVSTTLAVPSENFLLVSEKYQGMSLGEILANIRDNPLFGFGLFRSSQTNLTTTQLVKLWLGIRGVRFDRIQEVDLKQSKLIQEILLSDGSRAQTFNQPLLDQFIQNQFEDARLKEEGLSVGIYNATDHPGLAEKVARLITNIGGRVIFTANSPLPSSQSSVLGDSSSYARNFLSNVLGARCSPKSAECNQGNLGLDEARADINIIIGEDYFLRYNSPKEN